MKKDNVENEAIENSENLSSSETKQNSNSKLGIRLGFYFLGLFIMTLGIALSGKSNLGVSPVSSIPYTFTCIWGLEMGKGTILLHSFLVLFQIILLRKKFKVKQLLQVLVGVVFGYFTTLCNWVVSLVFPNPITSIPVRSFLLVLSIILIALGLFFYIPAKLIPLAGEGATLAISEIIKKPIHKVKTYFDVTLVSISGILCLIFLHNLGSVGVGTIFAAIFVGITLGIFNKFFGKWREKLY